MCAADLVSSAIPAATGYRMSVTSASTSARAHARSAVRAGTPRRAASARHARSASESPCALVIGRSRATSMQSAAVRGSIDSARLDPSALRSRAALSSGSLPSIASVESTSAQLTTLIAAPCAIASTTAGAPSSWRRTASSADASSAAVTSSAPGTAVTGFLVLSVFGCCFGAPVGDQLVNQAAAGRHIGEQAAHPFGCRAAPLHLEFGLRLRLARPRGARRDSAFGGVSHTHILTVGPGMSVCRSRDVSPGAQAPAELIRTEMAKQIKPACGAPFRVSSLACLPVLPQGVQAVRRTAQRPACLCWRSQPAVCPLGAPFRVCAPEVPRTGYLWGGELRSSSEGVPAPFRGCPMCPACLSSLVEGAPLWGEGVSGCGAGPWNQPSRRLSCQMHARYRRPPGCER